MEHLVIITPVGGTFHKYMRSFPSIFKAYAVKSKYIYYSYAGSLSSFDKVCELIHFFHFKDFSLVKETNYYRLKVWKE